MSDIHLPPRRAEKRCTRYPLLCPDCGGKSFELWIDSESGEVTGACDCGCEIYPHAEDATGRAN